jgi:hypothetical protein
MTPPFLTWALDGGECSVSHLCRFTPGERASGNHWIGGWVGSEDGLDAVEWKNLLSLLGIEPRSIARRYTDWASNKEF